MIAAHLVAGLLFAAAPAVRPVAVPPALLSMVGVPELSGVAWSPSLERYLVVTDDTAGSSPAHAPLVLAMTAAGALDEAPVLIRGLKSLNDAEAICAGPDGTLFVATSHSPNSKGKTKDSRRLLVQLALRERTLEVVGRVEMPGRRALLKRAGRDPDEVVDIEALAYREGALFIGLKAPLGPNGEATILRLEDPVSVMQKGLKAKRAIRPWLELPLCLDVAGSRVCQGISDMAFLPDGSLVVTANAPKGGPEDGGGAVWWVRAPLGATPPEELQRFAGLKPEGVTVSPDGRTLVVVFDRDREEPRWVELPLPRR